MTQSHEMPPDAGWIDAAGDSCTLPTADRPLRLAEFDALLIGESLAAHQVSATEARFELRRDAQVAGTAATLAADESTCCSFFEFALGVSDSALRLTVTVPPARSDVLEGLLARVQRARVQRARVPVGRTP